MAKKRSLEQRLAQAILGRERASADQTDAYKFSMAQTGVALWIETMYLCFRREGIWFNPFDLVKVIWHMRPQDTPNLKRRAFLQVWGYVITAAMEMALEVFPKVWAVPKGHWFSTKEPIITLTGFSFIVSWFEPNIIRLQYPLQVATAMVKGIREFDVTCEDEAEIIRICAEAVEVDPKTLTIRVREEEYRAGVYENARKIIDILERGTPGHGPERAFEVGMRGATCEQQHRIALEECKRAGWTRTSNLYLAYELNLIPVGTTGHEHQMRHGPEDIRGYRMIKGARPEMPSYLFDTTEPEILGIPDAIAVMLEDPGRDCSVRYDSGDQDNQFKLLWGASVHYKLDPRHIFEDSYDDEKTDRNESFLTSWTFDLMMALYGFGGYVTTRPAFTDYTRDVVSAGYKLSASCGEGKRKYSGSPGKASAPGVPVIFRRINNLGGLSAKYTSLIGQGGETPPDGFAPIEETTPATMPAREHRVGFSPATQKLVDTLDADRDARIEAARRGEGNAALMNYQVTKEELTRASR